MNHRKKIVVFTGNLSYSVRKGIVEIDRAIPSVSWLIVLHSSTKSISQLLNSQWRNTRRNGWRWIAYQASDLRRRLIDRKQLEFGPPCPGSEYTASRFESRTNMRLVRVTDINSTDSLSAIEAFEPDLGLSLAAPILRREAFSIPRLGTLNLHKGKVPEYRGMPPAFWELWNNEMSVGCTVHFVDEQLDTGNIVREATVERQKFSTLRGLQLQLDETGVRLMCEAVQDVLSETVESRPQASKGRTYRKPTLVQIARLDRELRGLQPPSSTLKEFVKDCRSRTAWGAWRLGLKGLLAPRITVLLYHRVSDDARDNLTVGIEQFDSQMALLRRHCLPLTIQQVLDSEVIPRTDGRPLVAVTFDDGYLDNYEHAAPALIRHGIPAAFFVTTGLIGTQERFPHDVRRGNPRIPLMNWDHLRTMREWGFTIGSHTVHHIDCATEPEETVRAELAQSRDHLRAELGLADCLFAYPYGGRNNMTAQRLELVKQAGYIGCLAAYGGTNVGSVDRFRVLRRGIHWEFSDSSFLFECLGLG